MTSWQGRRVSKRGLARSRWLYCPEMSCAGCGVCQLRMVNKIMKRFVIVAFSASPPGTMGGNTKIAIEMARHLQAFGWEVAVVVPRGKLATFTDNVSQSNQIEYWTVPDFNGNEFLLPISSSLHYRREIKSVFQDHSVGAGDIIFAICNFHVDILPLFGLKRQFGFTYIASHFLFLPFIVENLRNKYKFPVLKYLIGWFYERILFVLAKMQADAFVITNDSDRVHFSKTWRNRLFPFYGGVNVDQIPHGGMPKMRDVVFCSRLHQQKGIDGFLDIWKMVKMVCPKAHFTVIGNGERGYERYLKDKAKRLGVADSIDWLGYVNNEAKYVIYSSARVMVHPTVFDNNGMVAAEALCSGLPVVMYDLPALRHVYTTGCVKVPFGNKKAFAEEVVKLLSDDSYRVGVAPTTQEVNDLRNHWDWPHRVAMFAEWIENLNG